jgi:hypothetical protein
LYRILISINKLLWSGESQFFQSTDGQLVATLVHTHLWIFPNNGWTSV